MTTDLFQSYSSFHCFDTSSPNWINLVLLQVLHLYFGRIYFIFFCCALSFTYRKFNTQNIMGINICIFMSSTITSIGTSYPYNLVIGKLFASAMVSFVATYLPFNYFASITLISINILLGTFLVGTLPRGIMGDQSTYWSNNSNVLMVPIQRKLD